MAHLCWYKQNQVCAKLMFLLLETEISQIFLWWDHAVSPNSHKSLLYTWSSNHRVLTSTTLWHHKHYYEVTGSRRRYGEKRIEITLFIIFVVVVVGLIHFPNRRKIINHRVAWGTRESHDCVQNLQHPRLGKPRRGLQILDTRIGFHRPCRSVVWILLISLTHILSFYHVLIMHFPLYKS